MPEDGPGNRGGMLPRRGKIESGLMTQARRIGGLQEMALEYADIVAAAAGVFIVAWIADMLTGRRGLFAASLVSGVSAVCGWFLAVRVFGVATMDDFVWTVWAVGGAILGLAAFYLFRNTR